MCRFNIIDHFLVSGVSVDNGVHNVCSLHDVDNSDVKKDWTCKDKDKDKDQAYKDQDKDKDLTHKDQDKDKDLNLVLKDKDKDFTYSYLLEVAAKPTIAIKQQQWTQSERSQRYDCKTHYTK